MKSQIHKQLLAELNDKVTVTNKKTGQTYQISKNWYDSHKSNYDIAEPGAIPKLSTKPKVSSSQSTADIVSKSSLGSKKTNKIAAPAGILMNPEPHKSGVWGVNFYEDSAGTSVTVGKLPAGKYISPDRIQSKQHSLALQLKRQLKTKVLLRKNSIYVPGATGKEVQKAMSSIDKKKADKQKEDDFRARMWKMQQQKEDAAAHTLQKIAQRLKAPALKVASKVIDHYSAKLEKQQRKLEKMSPEKRDAYQIKQANKYIKKYKNDPSYQDVEFPDNITTGDDARRFKYQLIMKKFDNLQVDQDSFGFDNSDPHVLQLSKSLERFYNAGANYYAKPVSKTSD